MTSRLKMLVAASLVTVAGSISAAPAIIATTEPMGDKTAIAFDFVADKQAVSALMIEMKLAPGTVAKSLSLGNCLGQLSSTHTGGCSLKPNGNFAFLLYGAGDNVKLGSGPIGTIVVPTASLARGKDGSLSFPFVEFTLSDSNTISGNMIVDGKGSKRKGSDSITSAK